MKSFAVVLLITITLAQGQDRISFLPEKIDPQKKYVFYFHGGVVTVGGDNAVNQSRPEWGRYEYSAILDSLRKRGFEVISEIRKEGVSDSVYVDRVVAQIDTLLTKEVSPANIVLIGASAGSEIVLRSSAVLRNTSLKFVIMGACWPKTYLDWEETRLYGHFLSVIEASDPHGTCRRIFKGRAVSSFREVKLNTGLSHGFLYRGLKEWIDPVVGWGCGGTR
jgi:hypothetical protein